MGNQLVGIAPSQIFTVDWYLKDHPELKFDSSLGSTRFLKVAKVESQEGLVVVKVFAIHDPSLPLQTYKDHLEEIRQKLSNAWNCTPYQKFILTEKAGLIMREYVKYSLYDRISTRPFLTTIEKKWITFQILYALYQCHKNGVCHGDIKLENITVTSWNWVMLVDFASFKPTFLPVDNPGDYSYFFDTSRRRTCYIAPERFSNSASLNTNSALLAESNCDSGDLTPAMDIFSAGCCLLELWNELHFPFDYSQLLAYKAGSYSPQKHLDKLEDPDLKELVSSMIQKDPSKRLSAESYLAQYRGSLFPEYFCLFMHPYMFSFSSHPILSPDEKIVKLKGEIGEIFEYLGPARTSPGSGGEDEEEEEKSDPEKGECEGLVLIISLVTSCIRGLHECSSKLYSLEILLELARHASDETILDRIIPYVMYLAHDNNSRVKISAINTITKCLDLVKKVPRSDANIFPEYVLPELSQLATDPSTCVRAAYAKNITLLAEIALRYLDQIQNNWYEDNSNKQDDEHSFNYELELRALHQMVQETISDLLTDTHSIVKQALLSSGLHKLCVFFGKAKANDVILKHMITFINVEEDVQLRKSFFDCIVGVASYLGIHCSSILTPFLLQGLTDISEFVTRKAINAMSALTELNLISTTSLRELVAECCHFLVHPNLWIRKAVTGFIAKAASKMSPLDVQCKIMPHVKVYMKYSLIQIDKSELLLESLVAPIPRTVYDNVINYSDINMLMDALNDRNQIRNCLKTGQVPSYEFYNTVPTSLKTLLGRLQANGMTETVEDYLLKMAHHLKKINKHKRNFEDRTKQHEGGDSRLRQPEGKTEVDKLTISCTIKNRVFHLTDPNKTDYINNRSLQRTNTIGSIDTNVNSDWNYSAEVLTRQSESTNSGGPSSRSTSSRPSSPPPENHNLNTQFVSTTTDASSLHMKSYIQYRRYECYNVVKELEKIQQKHYIEALRSMEWAEQAAWKPQLPPPGWHPRGVLVAHLYEHKGAVNKLCRMGDSSFFASCSTDGFIRLWDCSKMEGRNIANRSKQQYKVPQGTSVTSIAQCEGGQSLAASTQDGTISILRVDPTSTKMNLVQSRQLNSYDEGFAVDVQCLDSGSQSVVIYATLYGDIVGWDLRQPGVAWTLENGLRQGVITTFCVDAHQSWLALGTSDGVHTAWDLRFHLPITTISLPSNNQLRIRKVIPHPTEHSWLMSSVQGNNEISMWNLETGSRQKVLWGSTAPPLSKMHQSSQTPSQGVCAMLSGCIDRSPFVLAGGTDQRLRFWNLESPSESYLAIPAASDPPGTTLSYRSRLIDGTDVIYEEPSNNVRLKDKGEETPRAGPEPPAAGHRDCISDIALCKASQCFLVTASRDGVIKVWK